MPDGDTPSVLPPAPLEALAVCPLCQAGLAFAALDEHLRDAHGVYTYRGVHRGLDDTLDAALEDLVRHQPDEAAWPALVRLAGAVRGADPDRFLAARLAEALTRLPEETAGGVAQALAPIIAPGRPGLLAALARAGALAGRRLALACLTQLQPPYDRGVRRAARVLLADGALPAGARVEALAALLPRLEERRAVRLLGRIVAGHGKARALDLLRRLERRTGPLPVLALFRERLEDHVRMSCPRCGVEMRRPAMLGHLWQEHRLVLDGLRVRDPWHVIEEWLDPARARRDRALIDRSRVAAEKIDPERGRERLERMLLVRGLADAPTRQALLGEARDQHAGRCPWCAALVPVPAQEPALAVKLLGDRLAGGSYRVAVDEEGLRPRLEVVTPAEVIFRGQEPDRPWTPQGEALLYSTLVVLVALLCAMLWPPALGRPIGPVVVLLLVAWLVHRGVRLARRSQTPLKERLIEHTWHFLVPELHAGGFRLSDSAFAAGLAGWYSRLGRTDAPPEPLAALTRAAEGALDRGLAPPGHLALLLRLRIETAAAAGQDPVPLVVQLLARCFEGKLPLAFAQDLLEDWAADWWTRANLARLRILVLDRAFEAGFEVQGVVDAGLNAPALGTVLAAEAPRSLAALRLIWAMRPSRPWDRLGRRVITAFELAADPRRAADLGERPDVLLWEEDPDLLVASVMVDRGGGKMRPARVQLTLAGLWLQEVIFSIPPRVFEVRTRTLTSELILGDVFRSSGDLEMLSRRLERWFRWVFHEFLPQVDGVLEWRSPERAAVLRAWGAIGCPECGRPLLPRVGEVGIALEEQASAGAAR